MSNAPSCAELEAALRGLLRVLPVLPYGPGHINQIAKDYDAAVMAARAALSRAAPAPATPPPHLREPREVWTPERVAMLNDLADKMQPTAVLARLNDLPGEPIASVDAVRLRYGLERSRGAA